MVQHLSGPLPLDDPRPGVTFAVDDVEPAETPLPTWSSGEGLAARLGRPVLASDVESESLVREPETGHALRPLHSAHPLFDAVHSAFGEHRPLVLSPDAIWLTIAQGVAHHLTLNDERLRDRVVQFEGKRELVVTWGRLASDATAGDWAQIIAEFAEKVSLETKGGAVPPLECSFSTTSPAARVASQVCLLEAHKRYFDLILLGVCGFPQITLLGTPHDWDEIRERVLRLRGLDLGWWVERLEPICEAFVEAAEGRPDREHWRRMYKLQEAYGTDNFNGWFGLLFAYLKDERDRPEQRNPFVLGERDALDSSILPNGRCAAPFRLVEGETTRMLEFVGGFAGVRQHASLALEPVAGWAVTDAGSIAHALQRIRESDQHRCSARTADTTWWREGGLAPAGFIELLEDFESIELYAGEPERVVQIVAPHRRRSTTVEGDGADSIETRVILGYGPRDTVLMFETDRTQSIVIAMEVDGEAIPIASCFEVFLERCLDEGAYFARPDFAPLDIALR